MHSKKLRSLIGIIYAIVLLTGCSGHDSNGIQRIALIAPFEGRYSEIGYDAYYAIRMAIRERGNNRIELLAIDDGGSESSASERAKALANDPLVKVVIALGNNATQPEAQHAFDGLTVLIVGQWNARPATRNIYILASKQLEGELTVNVSTLEQAAQVQSPVIGGEIFALSQFPLTSKNLNNVTIASSATLPDTEFRKRYLSGGQFVPEPGLLATLSYDAAGIALEAMQSGNLHQGISTTYNGLNGDIRFLDGYWASAPIYYYRYNANGKLTAENPPTK